MIHQHHLQDQPPPGLSKHDPLTALKPDLAWTVDLPRGGSRAVQPTATRALTCRSVLVPEVFSGAPARAVADAYFNGLH